MPGRTKEKTIDIIPAYKGYYELWAVGTILLYYVGLGLFVFLYIFLDRRARRYELGARSISEYSGIVRKTERAVSLETIKKIFVKQNFIQKYLNIGGLVILSNDASVPKIEIKYIEDPEGLKVLISRHYKTLKTSA